VSFDSLSEFVKFLEDRDELIRIDQPIDRKLEVTEIADRVMKSPGGGKALLFTNIKDSPYPLLINALGTMQRVAWALGGDSISELQRKVDELVKTAPPSGLFEKIKMLPKLAKFGALMPKSVNSGACQDVVMDSPNLSKIPILTCWPLDAGPFITFPLVVTRDPDTGLRNVGMYRMQVYDKQTTGMHWQVHKTGMRHYQRYKELGKRMPVSVIIGGDPSYTWSACAPLPDGIDEFMIAGMLRGRGVEMVKCKTNDLEVPANADFVIEGYVDPSEHLRREGPFGDHTGYYSLADDYPVFHVTAITHRKNPIYFTTIVGKPPMEDGAMGKAIERLSLPLLKMTFPEIVDVNLPVEACFHNLAIVSIKKQYPGHAQKIMHSIWGMGQLMFSKCIIVVDGDVDVQNPAEVLWRVSNNIDATRDLVLTQGPVDALDHASPRANLGGKWGIDATRKLQSEGHPREWPPDIVMSDDVKKKIDGIWKQLGIR